mmetsp:Transcript_801/g.2239  ORF Transcript_801/g.2239 Transcript_801/m.2239 type:complete len:209 (+) Transcript_801:678-1304(+)
MISRRNSCPGSASRSSASMTLKSWTGTLWTMAARSSTSRTAPSSRRSRTPLDPSPTRASERYERANACGAGARLPWPPAREHGTRRSMQEGIRAGVRQALPLWSAQRRESGGSDSYATMRQMWPAGWIMRMGFRARVWGLPRAPEPAGSYASAGVKSAARSPGTAGLIVQARVQTRRDAASVLAAVRVRTAAWHPLTVVPRLLYTLRS